MNKNKIVFWVVLAVVAATLVMVVGNRGRQTRATYAEFLAEVHSGEVAKATIAVAETRVDYILKNGARFQAIVPSNYNEALAAMKARRVNVNIESLSWRNILLNSTPFLVLLGFWFFMMRQLKNKPGPPRPA